MLKKSIFSIVTAACLLCSGCGTIVNLASPEGSKPKPVSVFGGVKQDLYDLKNNEYPVMGVFQLIDLPFSFVGDIVVLPITIVVNLSEEPKSLHRPRRKWYNPLTWF